MLLVLSVYLYQEFRPTVVFHTYKESGYLGKVSTFSGSIDKLYIKNHTAQYRFLHIWDWDDENEIAIFTKNYTELLTKKDIDFWRWDVFLDENGYYKSHKFKRYFWQKNQQPTGTGVLGYLTPSVP